MSDEIHRALGRLEGGQEAIKRELGELRTEMQSVATLAHQARGGLRMLSAVGAVAGVIGGAIGTLLMKLKSGI
jgi:hypothetical protein